MMSEEKKINKGKLLRRSILVLLLMACIGVFVAHKIAQRFGFEGIGEFITVYNHNKELAALVEPKEIQLLISDEDYAFLKDRRDVALERGIQINDGEDNYVKCKIVENGDTVKGEMRLKGHMTDHLEGDKWSFRVKTKKKPVMGMTRFSLQAPGTRNYAYEWIYHELLKNEDVIYLHYDFIRLKLNDKDLGIYAIEEHFGQHVPERNNRPNGAILRWNPNLYWEGRIDELQNTFVNQQYSGYSSSFVEPYESGTVEDDSNLVATYVKGAAMLESFRRGEKKASEIFDIGKMARFHAVIDLIGGHHSLDWSDVKFFYNSETGKIEPVGYESFSVRKTESIAGQRIPSEYEAAGMGYHDLLFSDPVFFAAYITELERISDEKYMDAFIKNVQAELDKKLGVLAHEFPYRKFTFDPYFENIELIRHNLALPKPFHAFKETSTDSVITISITPVSDFPVEIMSLSVDGKGAYTLDSAFVLPAKARNTYAHYFKLHFHHDAEQVKKLVLKARIPGSKNVFEVMVDDLPSYYGSDVPWAYHKSNESDRPNKFLSKLNDSVFFFNAKEVVINQQINLNVIHGNANHRLVVFAGQHVHFEENGSLISSGTIEMMGGSEEGERISITAEPFAEPLTTSLNPPRDSEKIWLTDGEMMCRNVDFSGASLFLWLARSDASFHQCAFADIVSRFVFAEESEVVMANCASGSVELLGKFDRSLVRIKDFTANNGSRFIAGYGSDIEVWSSAVKGYKEILELNYSSSFTAWNSVFEASASIAVLDHASSFNTYGGNLSAATGFVVNANTRLPGESVYSLYKTGTEFNVEADTKKI